MPQASNSEKLPFFELYVVMLARVVINTTQRMIYPFLPAIGRGLGVAPGAMRVLVGARSAAGFASPLFGPLSDRFGRRAVMLLGLAMLSVSLVLIPIWPVYSVALIAFTLIGLAKVIYDPAMQAYFGDRVAYDRRGLAMGVLEVSWSAALLVGAPVVGLSIQRFGWTSPFVGLTGMALLAMVGILIFIRHDAGAVAATRGNGLSRTWVMLRGQPAALGLLGFALLIDTANEIMFVVYGEWMEGSFGLQVGTLGLLTAVIGLAELGGELIVAVGSDRLGKRRVVLVGLVVSALAYALLPRLGVSLPVAMGLLFVMFVSFEATIVGSIPIASELVPQARGTMMAAFLMAFLVGRTAGALVSGWLLRRGGFALIGMVAGALNLLAFVLVMVVVRENLGHTEVGRDASRA